MTTRVLLVDDSPSALHALRSLLKEDPRFNVVGEARSSSEAVSLAEALRPDLVTMDVFLGGQDGVDAARAILQRVATRIVLVTGTDRSRADLAFRALSAGALDVLSKPSLADDNASNHQRRRFMAALSSLAVVSLVRKQEAIKAKAPLQESSGTSSRMPLFVLGASTGGPKALHTILEHLPRPFPVPVVIVQHIEPGYDHSLAGWLSSTGHDVGIVSEGCNLRAGCVYVAPGTSHIRMKSSGVLVPEGATPREFQLPSIDELFESIATQPASRVFAALLSGMGSDGARGLVALSAAGATTVVQSLESCVVAGMPAAALAEGGARLQLSPEEIATTARRFFDSYST
jgi:two-component system chemotaxis response regulator CheB